MTNEEKRGALLAVAEAYLKRGEAIQYDQLSMDRLLRVTPRHQRYAAPEEATAQHRVYEDCACFVCAVYYHAFGFELEADVTWNMMELVGPTVYEYVSDGTPVTPEKRAAIRREVLGLLRAGDVLVLLRAENGHAMLVGEKGMYYHCTQKGGENSYNYAERHDTPSPGGAIRKEPMEERFDPDSPHDLLSGRVRRFRVLRPLDRMGDPTPAALARLGDAAGLRIGTLCTCRGGMSVGAGDIAVYTVCVLNESGREVTAWVSVTPADGTRLSAAGRRRTVVPAGGTVRLEFPVEILPDGPALLPPPDISVNGLPVWAERLLVHAVPEPTLAEAAAEAENGIPSGWSALTAAYEKAEICLPESELRLLTDWFARYDSRGGDVLWRKPQAPRRDGGLYGYFGGYGVITPEAMTDPDLRVRSITASDLRRGDVILCSDDALFQSTYFCLATREGLLGRFAPDGAVAVLREAERDRFIDSLPGRFCYGVLRPGMKVRGTPWTLSPTTAWSGLF